MGVEFPAADNAVFVDNDVWWAVHNRAKDMKVPVISFKNVLRDKQHGHIDRIWVCARPSDFLLAITIGEPTRRVVMADDFLRGVLVLTAGWGQLYRTELARAQAERG